MEKKPSYYPLDEEFGYSVQHHRWLYNGQVLSDEEATPIYQQKMNNRVTAAHDQESIEKESKNER